LIIANKELAFQNDEKESRAAELIIANKELAFQNDEKESRAAELVVANKELAFQNEQKEKRAEELVIANEELLFQNEEKEKRAEELLVANELFFKLFDYNPVAMALRMADDDKFTNVNESFLKLFGFRIKEEVIGKSSFELNLLHESIKIDPRIKNEKEFSEDSEISLRNKKGETVWVSRSYLKLEVDNRPCLLSVSMDITEGKKAEEKLKIINATLLYENKEKHQRAYELLIANAELLFQSEEKEKRAGELLIANKELAYQNDEKEHRAAELVIANRELAYQNDEKESRAAELVIANEELVFQNGEKEDRAAELVVANKELAYQNEEKEKRADELVIANVELLFQNEEKEKRAGELLVANELFFKMFDYNPASMAIRNIETGKLINVNAAFLKLFGFSNKGEVIGKSSVELNLLPSQESITVESIIGDEEKYIKDLEINLRNRKGEMVWVSTSFMKLEVENTFCLLTVSIDISERKRAESYRDQLASIVDTTEDAIISKTRAGTIKTWNKGSEKMFGYTAKQAIGKNICLIIPDEYVEEEKKIIQRVIKGETLDHYETVRKRKNGKQFQVSLSVSPIKDSAGNIVGISKIAREIITSKKEEKGFSKGDIEKLPMAI
jgi:PAS domain S-box-containing protein